MTMAMARRSGGDLEEFDNGSPPAQAMVEVASNRAAQEVQAAMVVAKKFPRDTIAAYNRILQSCRRKGLAKASMYEYPRGGEKITGPSIRLAESLAQNWGNLDFGIVELEQRDGESTVMAYAWDLETNTRQTKIFQVRHERHTKRGSYDLKDPRDIYELVANQGARRLRACILGVIPGDIVDAAVDECEKTLSNSNGDGPLVDRVRAMIAAFADLQVTQPMIEKLLLHKADTISERELIRLRKIYASIRDGMSAREDHFDLHAGEAATGSEVESRMRQQQGGAKPMIDEAEAERIIQAKAAQARHDTQDVPPEEEAIERGDEGQEHYPFTDKHPAGAGAPPLAKIPLKEIDYLVRDHHPRVKFPHVRAAREAFHKLLPKPWDELEAYEQHGWADLLKRKEISWD